MKTARLALSLVSALILGGGFLAAQWFAFEGRAPEWAQRVDQPSVIILSLAILLAAIGLAFVRDREAP